MGLLPEFAIDVAVAKSVVAERYGGQTDKILEVWEARKEILGKVRDRSTVRRWVGGEVFPRTQHDLLALCSLLDVDPFALIAVTRGGELLTGANAFAAARALLWLTPSLGFIREFFGRQQFWPPTSLGEKTSPLKTYFPGAWHTRDLIHGATDRIGYYQALELSAESIAPRVWHIAYRPLIEAGRWLHYGAVARFPEMTRLLNARGYIVEQPTSKRTFVETWFGPEPAAFRVASLHPFECKVADLPRGAPALRFNG